MNAQIEAISDKDLGEIAERNGHPSVAESLALGRTQAAATAYIVGDPPRFRDGEGRWFVAYIEWLHRADS
jgi:hypothetical protein